MAVPLNRRDGSYFGTLCAFDPLPANLDESDFAVFHLLAQLIAFELEADEHQQQREAELRALEDFIAIAAHDLRQPLTVAQFAAPEYTFEFSAPATLPLVADAPRLGQVLRNLLDNGVKYSPDRRGPIVLTMQALPGEARVYVQDSGIGVPADQLAHLFTRRYRADNAVARHIGGTGLGLYIAQQIVAAHGGRISADASAGGGLRVCLTLPRS